MVVKAGDPYMFLQAEMAHPRVTSAISMGTRIVSFQLPLVHLILRDYPPITPKLAQPI